MPYVPLSKCSECPVVNIDSCHIGLYYFPSSWLFEGDAQVTFFITNQVGVKYVFNLTLQGQSLIWDMDTIPEGWKDETQSLYVEVMTQADPSVPSTFTINPEPATYSCFWVNFYKVQE